jgi:protein TonB
MDFSEHGHDRGNKFTGITVVVVIHALLIYALVNGLGKSLIAVIKEAPIETKVIEEVKPPPPPPDAPPPPPKLAAPPPPFIPPPEVQVATPPSPNAISAVSNVQPPHQDMHPQTAAVKPTPGPSTTKAVYDPASCKPEYPRNSLRNEEQGVSRVVITVGADGKVLDSQVAKSSGFRALDVAAKNAFSQCAFKPGTIDGKPQQTLLTIDYVWKLDN